MIEKWYQPAALEHLNTWNLAASLILMCALIGVIKDRAAFETADFATPSLVSCQDIVDRPTMGARDRLYGLGYKSIPYGFDRWFHCGLLPA